MEEKHLLPNTGLIIILKKLKKIMDFSSGGSCVFVCICIDFSNEKDLLTDLKDFLFILPVPLSVLSLF